MSKNEYGIETINGYVVIPNLEYWNKYKEYFSIRAWNTDSLPGRYHCKRHKPDQPEQYPCIVDTEYEFGGDYEGDYWQHTFIYENDIRRQLGAIIAVQEELEDE